MREKFRLGARPLIAAVVTAVMVAVVAVGALTVGAAQAQGETCPDGGAWTKYEGVSGFTYTFNADSGKVITEICWKNGTNVGKKVIDPGQTTVNLNITGEQNELSHVAMKQEAQPTATPVTPTDTPETPTATPDPTATPQAEPDVQLESLCVVREGVGQMRLSENNGVGPIQWSARTEGGSDITSGELAGGESLLFEAPHPDTIIVDWTGPNDTEGTTDAVQNTPSCGHDPTATPRPTQTPGPPDDNAGPGDGGMLPILIMVAVVSGLMVLNNARRWYLSR